MTWDELMGNLNREDAEGPVGFSAEGLAFLLTASEAGDAVLLSADLDPLPAGDSRAFLREMLEANHLFAGTGGASLSVDPDTLQPSIQQFVRIDLLDFEAFMARLACFVSRAAEWNRKVAGMSALEPAPVFWPGTGGLIMA